MSQSTNFSLLKTVTYLTFYVEFTCPARSKFVGGSYGPRPQKVCRPFPWRYRATRRDHSIVPKWYVPKWSCTELALTQAVGLCRGHQQLMNSSLMWRRLKWCGRAPVTKSGRSMSAVASQSRNRVRTSTSWRLLSRPRCRYRQSYTL